MLARVIPFHQLIDTIISVLNARDPYTFEHSWRVAHISEIIARKMNIEEEWVELIHIAAHLHDIGKVGIPDNILNKSGSLTDVEYNTMKSHPKIGYDIVKNIELLEETSRYILYHHERWDGKGYPEGLSGKDIPLGARIIALADSFDAMTSKRSYKSATPVDKALSEIKRCRGTQFCPEVVDAFLTIESEIEEVLNQVNNDLYSDTFTLLSS